MKDFETPSDILQPEATPVRFTPRQLINHHIQFPEQPITNEHIENLILKSYVVQDIEDYSLALPHN